MLDALARGAEFAEIVRGFVEREVAPLRQRIAELEARQPEKGERGEPGPAGADGKDGEPGKDGRDGVDGAAGTDGLDGKDGSPGERGLDGKDAIGMAGAIIDRDGNLTITTTAGEAIKLGAVVGRDGADGKDGRDGQDGQRGEPGRDGFSLEAFDATLKEDGRTVELSFEQGDERYTVELAIPAMIYRGVFRDGGTYVRGDTVTWAGSLWHCEGETTEKPGVSKAWTLAVKRGADGKDGEKGEPGKKGDKGDPGVDRRH